MTGLGVTLMMAEPVVRRARRSARLAVLAAWVSCLVLHSSTDGAWAQSGLFQSNSTVILVTGVPGDVESESAFHEQLETWLEIAQSAKQVREVFVLCDNPESVTTPDSAHAEEVKVLEASRSGFLNLSRTLAGRTNALVVIAWGHGGKQGAMPVFHVRGPRLTPVDFKTFAESLPSAESRWILFFPGSGSFAAALAGQSRRILASECDTTFASDPIGMTLLLKQVRANPAASFEALGEGLGSATVEWYKDRSLARTEEPTLWEGAERPRMLADNSEKDALASAKPGRTDDNASNVVSKPEVESGARPAAWKDVKRVKAQKYPDADGVLLRHKVTYTLAANPAVAAEQEDFIQVLTPEGKRFGDFDISYSPPMEDITFLDCEVEAADGTLTRLDPDNIREAAEPAPGDYHTGQRKFFSLPGVVPGAVLHVRYRTEWKDFPMPHVSLDIPISMEMPVVESQFQISVPKDSAFHFAFEGMAYGDSQTSAADPVIKQSDYGTTYLWRFENLAAQEHEALTPPREGARLLLSTFPDWGAFAEWYGRITRLTDEVTPEVEGKAMELTRGASTDRDKVLAIYNYVTRLRYVAVPLGVNSFRPHSAANVLANQFGDCKDKANLFNALLHAVAVDADLVLVPRMSQANEAVPGFAFNHAISRVTLGGKAVWVDTTDDVCRFGMLPPGDPGRKVLVVATNNRLLSQLPAPDAKDHSLTLRGEIDCSSAGPGLPATLNAAAHGFPDYELRVAAREENESRSSIPLLAARYRPAVGVFALEKQHSASVAALNEDYTWGADGTYYGASHIKRGKRALLPPFWLPIEWDLALHQRRSPLFLNQGYPLTLEEDFHFTMGPSTEVIDIPEVAQSTEPPLRWRLEWARMGDGKLVARFHVELAQGELSTADTPIFQRQMRELLAAMAAGASISTSP